MTPIRLLALCVASLLSLNTSAEEIIVAVASNFLHPMQDIVAHFEQTTDHRVKLVNGSSGKLFAHIQHGAPFHVFFSADQSKPTALVDAGLAPSESRFTYAVGALALWSAQSDFVQGAETLKEGRFNKLAIANPRLAPYGVAAMEVLENLGLREPLDNKLVQGENIGQTFQFVSTGNATLGFVALSQVFGRGGSAWRVPADLHEPIRQDAVLLPAGKKSMGALCFMQFVRGEHAISIMQSYGYRAVPEG